MSARGAPARLAREVLIYVDGVRTVFAVGETVRVVALDELPDYSWRPCIDMAERSMTRAGPDGVVHPGSIPSPVLVLLAGRARMVDLEDVEVTEPTTGWDRHEPFAAMLQALDRVKPALTLEQLARMYPWFKERAERARRGEAA